MSMDDVMSGLTDLINKFSEIPDKLSTEISLEGDPSSDINSVKDELADLDGTVTSADVEVTGDTSSIEEAKTELDEIDGTVVSAEITADDADAMASVDEVKEALEDIDNTTVSADINTEGAEEATSSAGDAVTAITAIASAVAVADAEVTRMGSERSLQKALSYEGLPTTTSNVSNLRAELSQVQGAIPTDEASSGVYILAKGLKNAADVSAELPPAFKLIKTTGMDTSTAMYDLSSILTAYDLHGDAAVSTTQYLNEAILDMNSSAGDSATILNTVTSLLPTMKSLGYRAEDIVNYIGAFGDAGINAGTAATALTAGSKALSKQLTSTSYDSSKAKKALDAMGISAKNSDGTFRSTADIMNDVIEATTSLTDAQFQAQYGISKTEALTAIFGSRGALVFKNLGESAEDYGDKVEGSGDKTTDTMSDINSSTMTLQTQFQKLWNTITNAPALPTWLFEGIAFTVAAAIGIKGIKLVTSSLKDVWDFVGKIKGKFSEGDWGAKAKDIWRAVFGTDEMSKEVALVETSEGSFEKVESKFANTIRKFKSDVKDLKESNVWKTLFGDEKGNLNLDVPEDASSKVGDMVDKIKNRIGELKDSNVWRMLFGDEKGSFNFSSITDVLLAPFKQTKNTLNWMDLVKGAESGGRGYTQINIGNLIPGWTDGKIVKPNTKPWVDAFNEGIKELKTEFKADHPDILREVSNELVGLNRYGNSLEMASFLDDTRIKFSEGWTSIEIEMGVFKERYKTDVKEIKDTTKGLFGDEKGTINTDLNSIFSSISDFVDRTKAKLGELKDYKISIGGGTTGTSSKTGTSEAIKLSDGTELYPPGTEPKSGTGTEEPIIDKGSSGWFDGIKSYLKTWKTIPKFNAASLGRGLLGLVADAEALPMMVGTAMADYDLSNLTPEQQAARKKQTDPLDAYHKQVEERRKQQEQQQPESSFWDQINLPGWIQSKIKPSTATNLTSNVNAVFNPVKTIVTSFNSWLSTHAPKVPKINWNTIKDGFNSPVQWLKTQWNNLKQWVTTHTPKVPKINWSTLQSGLAGPLNWVKTQYNNFKQWIITHTPKIPNLSWGNLTSGMWGVIGWAESTYEGLRAWVVNHTPQIPKLPWGNLTSGLKGIVDNIVIQVNRALDAVKKLPGVSTVLGTSTGTSSSASSWGSGFMGDLASGISAGQSYIDKSLRNVRNYFPHSPPKTGPLAEIKSSNMFSWMSSIMGAGVNALDLLPKGITSTFKSIPTSMYGYGSSIMEGLMDGFKSRMPAFSGMLGAISNLLPHSPPKEGPLSLITRTGTKNWTSSIAQAGIEGFGGLTNIVNGISSPKIPSIPQVPRTSGGCSSVILNFNEGSVVVNGETDSETAKKTGREIADTATESMATKLNKQAGMSGISVLNNMRR